MKSKLSRFDSIRRLWSGLGGIVIVLLAAGLAQPALCGPVYGLNESSDGCKNGSGGADPAGGQGGPGCSSCSSGGAGGPDCCNGVPVWSVSEPYINVWVYDEPLGYQPGLGSHISFKLAYKQRDFYTRSLSTSFFSLGTNWNCSWLSYIIDGGSSAIATQILPLGGQRTNFPDNSTREYFSRSTWQRTTALGIFTGYILSNVDGSVDYYQLVPGIPPIDNLAFLTAKVDAAGNTTTFIYNQTPSLVTLAQVIDADGHTNTLSYANTSFPGQITGVQDAFGRSTTLAYDAYGNLTNVTDVSGLSSSFAYDGECWITNLTTPYGTTTLSHYTNDSGYYSSYGEFWCEEPYGACTHSNYVIRSVKVVDPVGGTNIYMLRQNSTNLYIPPVVWPSGGPIANLDIPVSGNDYRTYRDTFFWGPRQSQGSPLDPETFTPSDYDKARVRHWLHDPTIKIITQTLSYEQLPSPDGVTVTGRIKMYHPRSNQNVPPRAGLI